jgi:hypothetical protein
MTAAVTAWLVLVLGVSAGLKARRADRAASALTTYGIASARGRRVAMWGLIAIELALAITLAAGVRWAPAAAAGMFLAFALVTSTALLAGREGQPCACFGSDSRLSWASPARAAALTLVAGVLASGRLGQAPSSYDRWLTVGLALSVAAIAVLAVAVLALAREVGVLRMGTGRGALEIADEGPPVGSTQAWGATVSTSERTLLRLAIFTSEGCPMCRQLAPAVEHVAADPVLGVSMFDEVADAAIWRLAQVPGSPYAIALDRDGVVLAKGTFNSLGQLESILGTARVREREMMPVAA